MVDRRLFPRKKLFEFLNRAFILLQPLFHIKKHQMKGKASVLGRVLHMLTVASFLIAGTAFGQPSEEKEVEVWAVPATQKVRPNGGWSIERSDYAYLIWTPASQTVSVAGAKNEHVPFQVVLSDPGNQEPVSGLFVEVSDLISDDGRIPNSQVDLNLEYYSLLYKKSGPTGAIGLWPDALPPLTNPFSMASQERLEKRAVWVDVEIPKDVPSGSYAGTITVTQKEQPVKEINLSLEVYDFALPDTTHLLTHMDVGTYQLAEYYGFDAGSEKLKEMVRRYYNFLSAHRMDPWHNDLLQPKILETAGNEVSVQFNEDDYKYQLEKLKIKRVILDANPGGLSSKEKDLGSEAAKQRASSYLKQVYNFFREHEWLNRLVFNSPIDEPSSKAEYETTRQWADLVHQQAPGVPLLATEAPVADDPAWGTLRGYVDNFSVHGDKLADEEVEQAIRKEKLKGGEITWYISCDQGYPQPNYFIDRLGMDPLMVPWITARYGMDGILYWATAYWNEVKDPWLDPITYHNGYFCGGENGKYMLNGEGFLLYPGDVVNEYTEQDSVQGPVASLRLKLLREGIEDYEYIWLLKSLGGEEMAKDIVKQMVYDVRNFSRSAEQRHAIRKEVARRIEELSQ